jgi:hypothetical protein|tara:strand:- start:531 stop:716 length:186 start_codon:yes stop_codon:yes gene_type:complete
MKKEKELKEIIRIQTPLADMGSVSAMQMVINAQIELDQILDNRKAQATFLSFLLAQPNKNL